MTHLIEELMELDRPYLPIKVKIKSKELEFLARVPSAFEQDTVDGFFDEEYGRLLHEKTTPRENGESELDRVRFNYRSKDKSLIVSQLLTSRGEEIETQAYELLGIDFKAVAQLMTKMTDEERTEYVKEQEERLVGARKEARETMKAELEASDVHDLIEQLSNLNINYKAVIEAQNNLACHHVFLTLYVEKDAEGKPCEPTRVFDSPEAVRKTLQPDTIALIVKSVKEAFKGKPNLPFKLPDDQEPAKPSSSQSTSVEATPTSGAPISTTPES